MNTLSILTIMTLFILTSCEKSTHSSKRSTSSTHERMEPSIENKKTAHYQAKLIPLNGRVSGMISGSLNLVREDDRLYVHVRVSGGPKETVAHVQNIRNGKTCPDESADTNGDGYIDIIEGMPYFGDSIIPLDGDLNSQKGGANYWPLSDPFGDYQYSEIAYFDRLFEDLKKRDDDLNDDLVKLMPDEEMGLNGKVVVIHGIPSTFFLPPSVATRGPYSAAQMIPIACGVISTASAAPGVLDDGKASWDLPPQDTPIGETVGGSSGADDGAIFREPTPIDPSGQGLPGSIEPTRDNRVEPDDSSI